jgi:hypothetical protein
LHALSESTSYPEIDPYLNQYYVPRVADLRNRDLHSDVGEAHRWPPRTRYRGTSRTEPRRGEARAPRAVTGHVCGHQCVALPPALLRAVGGQQEACRRFCQVRLKLDDNPYGGIACWAGAQAWVELHVPDAYRRGYRATVLPQLRKIRGGGISLDKVKGVALAMAQAAGHNTGRESRLTVATIMDRTGFGKSTVERARTALRLLGLATEVFRGRQRTYAERMASWRVGDRARGWASVWALHPVTPVDKTRIIRAGQVQMAPHPHRGLFSPDSSSQKRVTTHRTVQSGAASRRSRPARARRVSVPDSKGAVLASRWLRSAQTPAWARQHTPAGWASALAESARYGWNADDLNAIITDWARAAGVAPTPAAPIAFMRWLIGRHDLAFSPTILDQAAREQDQTERAARRDDAAIELAKAAAARTAGQEALAGPGRTAAREILNQHRTAAPARKAAARRAEHAARDAAIARARTPR